MQDCVRAEVKELFRRSICFTEGGIWRGTDIGWFSNRTGTGLTKRGETAKNRRAVLFPLARLPSVRLAFARRFFAFFAQCEAGFQALSDLNRGTIRTSCAMSRSLAIGVHFLFNPVQVPLWLMLRLALSLIEVTEGIAFFLFVSLLEWCAFDNIQYMGSGRTERLLRSASNVSVAQHALPGCVERYAWRGRSRKPQTLAS